MTTRREKLFHDEHGAICFPIGLVESRSCWASGQRARAHARFHAHGDGPQIARYQHDSPLSRETGDEDIALQRGFLLSSSSSQLASSRCRRWISHDALGRRSAPLSTSLRHRRDHQIRRARLSLSCASFSLRSPVYFLPSPPVVPRGLLRCFPRVLLVSQRWHSDHHEICLLRARLVEALLLLPQGLTATNPCGLCTSVPYTCEGTPTLGPARPGHWTPSSMLTLFDLDKKPSPL